MAIFMLEFPLKVPGVYFLRPILDLYPAGHNETPPKAFDEEARRRVNDDHRGVKLFAEILKRRLTKLRCPD
jgi:hypothetical protein